MLYFVGSKAFQTIIKVSIIIIFQYKKSLDLGIKKALPLSSLQFILAKTI